MTSRALAGEVEAADVGTGGEFLNGARRFVPPLIRCAGEHGGTKTEKT